MSDSKTLKLEQSSEPSRIQKFLASMDGLVKWLAFSVLMTTALPIGLSAFRILGLRENVTGSELFRLLLSRGDMSLIAVAIVVTSIGELIVSPKTSPKLKSICGSVSLILAVIAAVHFAMVSGWSIDGIKYNEGMMATISLWLYGFSIVAGAGCILSAGE